MKEVKEFHKYLLSLPCQVYNYLCLQKGVKEMQKILSSSIKECHTILINKLGSSISIVMMDHMETILFKTLLNLSMQIKSQYY